MSEELVWGEPPALESARWGVWEQRTNPLRERPGVWARVATFVTRGSAYGSARALELGRFRGIAPSEFETQVRRVSDEWGVWARYIGNGSSGDDQ